MNKPIFIIGCPRSGTTLTLNIVAQHEELAWINDKLNVNPLRLDLTRFNRIYDLPLVSNSIYLTATQSTKSVRLPSRVINLLPIPVEPWQFWNFHLQNFQWERGGSVLPRRRTKDDISPSEVLQIRQTVKSICEYQKKRRFLSKYTDFPRITYLNEAFEDALFIHIIRDGRAVAASYLKEIESGRFGTWGEREWWIKGWPTAWQDEWVKEYKTPLSFVAFQWKFFISEIWEDKKTISKSRYIEIYYKDIITNPHSTFDRLFEFCELKKSKRVASYLGALNLSNMDQKWKKRFNAEEKEILFKIVGDTKFKHLLDDNV